MVQLLRISELMRPFSPLGPVDGGGGETDMRLQLPIIDGRYYTSPHFTAKSDNNVGTGTGEGGYGNRIFAIPVVFQEAKTWSEISVYCDTPDASGAVRLGIFADDDGIPGALVVDAEEATLGATGHVPKTISQAIPAETRHWLAAAVGASGTALISGFVAPGVDSHASRLYGWMFGFSEDFDGAVAYVADHTYGALPATFPSANRELIDFAPLIALRTGV
jgi:hypothetical protein